MLPKRKAQQSHAHVYRRRDCRNETAVGLIYDSSVAKEKNTETVSLVALLICRLHGLVCGIGKPQSYLRFQAINSEWGMANFPSGCYCKAARTFHEPRRIATLARYMRHVRGAVGMRRSSEETLEYVDRCFRPGLWNLIVGAAFAIHTAAVDKITL